MPDPKRTRRARDTAGNFTRRSKPTQPTKTKKTDQKPENAKLLTVGSNGSIPPRDEVATFAYLIWEQRGRTDGHDVDDWLEAEAQLAAKHS